MRAAIFVDAGYLYAAGQLALAPGSTTTNRAGVELDQSEIMVKLRATAAAKTGGAPLLRIYWYDGMLPGGLSQEQRRLANTDDVKLRLGAIIGGRQKGVDSLIITDLIELARNHAISDAVLLSGDEDLRVGVQIAQGFGVRAHLIGIEPRRNQGNQSHLLLQEADTTTEWSNTDIGEVLKLKPSFDVPPQEIGSIDTSDITIEATGILDVAVAEFVTLLGRIPASDVDDIKPDWIPPEYDRPLIARCGDQVGRRLNSSEMSYVRDKFREEVGTQDLN